MKSVSPAGMIERVRLVKTSGNCILYLVVCSFSWTSGFIWNNILPSTQTMCRYGMKRSRLTQFWCFTKYKGICPELADGPIVKALVTNWLFKPFCHQDVSHVAPSTDGTEYTKRTERQNKQMEVEHSLNRFETNYVFSSLQNPKWPLIVQLINSTVEPLQWLVRFMLYGWK